MAVKMRKYSRKLKSRRMKTRGFRRTRRVRHSQKGGSGCFGTGVGANNNDPNFSIYNTRELQLFPYKPV